MNAAALPALALYVWTRNRRFLTATAAVYVLALVGVAVLPADARTLLAEYAGPVLRLAPIVSVLVFLPSLELTGLGGYSPKHLLTLPVSTHALVAPFMLGALLLVGVLWLTTLVLFVGPTGLALPNVWVPVFHVDIAAWALAFAWLPFRQLWIKVLLIGVLTGALGLAHAPDQSLLDRVPPAAIAAFAFLQLPLAYRLALWGVTQARRGDPALRASSLRRPKLRAALEPFRSAQRALGWLEWRQSGYSLLIVGSTVVLALALLSMLSSRLPMTLYEQLVAPGAAPASKWTGMFFVPIWFCVMAGTACATSRKLFYEPFTMPSFLAVLPHSTGDMAWAKLRNCARTVPPYFAVTFVLTAALAMAFGGPQSLAGVVATLREQHGVHDANVLLAFAALAFVLLTAGGTLNVLWASLAGGNKGSWYCTLGGFVLLVASEWLVREPEWRALAASALPIALPVAAAAKLAVLAWLIQRVGSRGLYTWPRLQLIAGTWIAAVTACLLLLFGFFPETAEHATTAACAAVLLVPVVPIVGAPLALERNRRH